MFQTCVLAHLTPPLPYTTLGAYHGGGGLQGQAQAHRQGGRGAVHGGGGLQGAAPAELDQDICEGA